MKCMACHWRLVLQNCPIVCVPRIRNGKGLLLLWWGDHATVAHIGMGLGWAELSFLSFPTFPLKVLFIYPPKIP